MGEDCYCMWNFLDKNANSIFLLFLSLKLHLLSVHSFCPFSLIILPKKIYIWERDFSFKILGIVGLGLLELSCTKLENFVRLSSRCDLVFKV